jgi:hypothetical protein
LKFLSFLSFEFSKFTRYLAALLCAAARLTLLITARLGCCGLDLQKAWSLQNESASA